MPSIVVSHLTKMYQFHRKEPGLRGSLGGIFRRQTLETRAVDGVTFSIEPGEVVGFLGPNGAGKTTTLKMLTGLLYPTSGSLSVLGYTPSRREADFLRRIALVMGQKTMLWWDLPAMETLLLHQEMYGIDARPFRDTVDELSAMLDVGRLLTVQVRKLSLGERMKMELLAALVHQPEVLFLDEPTIGLDVVAQQRVRDFLRRLNRDVGTTVLLTSHDMDDIEELCPRVLVIERGRIYFDGALSTLVERAAPRKVLHAVFAEPVAPALLSAALDGVEVRPSADPTRVSVSVEREQTADVAARLLRLGGVADLSIEEAPVEEIVRGIFDRDGRDDAPPRP